MAQTPRKLTPERDAQSFFGAELRRWRELRGLSQETLGQAVFHSGATIGKVEKAMRWPQFGLVEGCDGVLRTGGVLARMWPLIEAQRAGLTQRANDGNRDLDADMRAEGAGERDGLSQILRLHVDDQGQVWAMIGRRALLVGAAATVMRHSPVSANATSAQVASLAGQDDAVSDFDAVVRATWPGARVCSSTNTLGQSSWALNLPGGAAYGGSTTGIHIESTTAEHGQPIRIPSAPRPEPGNRPPPRLMIAARNSGNRLSYVAATPRSARASEGSRDAPALDIPAAYLLDDLTYAGLWAVTNLDQALLGDDAALAQAHARTRGGVWAQRHEVARREVPDLAAVSQMWLGSDFCARYIMGHLDQFKEVPVFWTREQRGEDASTWLLFAHKLDYLRGTTALYSGQPDRPVRIFCVPESTVTDSGRPERILLLLSAALMEAHGITVQITTEPAYSDVPGFILGPSSKTSMLATWLRDEKVWHVDEAAPRTIGRAFATAAGDASAASMNAAPTPLQRLERLTYYLGLDWRWLRRRAAEMSTAGWSGLAAPQSRLLSVTGLDEACRFLAATA